MMIMVAGPYSADSEEKKHANLETLNRIAAAVLAKGHIPVIGLNAALPVVAKAEVDDRYEAVMRISLALAERCDAILIHAESPGVNAERAVLERRGCPVYFDLSEIPVAS